jgi:hypothetical protein
MRMMNLAYYNELLKVEGVEVGILILAFKHMFCVAKCLKNSHPVNIIKI